MRRVSVASSRRDRVFQAACFGLSLLPLFVLGVFVLHELPPHGGRVVDVVSIASEITLPALVLAIPIGFGAALWLEEIALPGRTKRLVDWSARLLASVPPILLGLLGFLFCARSYAQGTERFAAPLMLAFAMVPRVISTSRSALAAVPAALRDAAFALGAARVTVLGRVVLPMAWPAILEGFVRSLVYGLGELGLLLVLLGETRAASSNAFFRSGAQGMVVPLLVVLALQGAASFLRLHFERRRSRAAS